ncbi:MAG TPA: type II toxin-antitoxin system HipA family toxin [Trueperaceae bacterium]
MRRLEVRLDWGTHEVRVGTLAQQARRILFEYHPAFLRHPLPLSPFQLPPEPGLFEDAGRTFGGLFGVFNDSLPDGWGLLLMDRHFRKQGIIPEHVSPLDRLAYIGTRGMGALTYHPATDVWDEPPPGLDLARLARQAQRILEGSPEDVLPALRIAGGSPGGARPKVLVGVDEDGEHLLAGTDDLPAGYRYYLVKFGTHEDGRDIGAIEAAYALMASQAGISMPATRLFETADGARYFGAERFDRNATQRTHVHTLSGLLHASHRLPSMDYEGFLKATLALTKDHQQLKEAFRRMVFNVFAHNRDDHVKNFSFMMDPEGQWKLSPAYDLVFSEGINGWHTMDIAGEAEDPSQADMLEVAKACGLSRQDAGELIEQVRNAVSRWDEFARAAGVSRANADGIGKVLAAHVG